jgi:Tfp pilus assembly protein PilF
MTDQNKHSGSLFKVRYEVWVYLFLILTALAVYGQVTTHSFVDFDDDIYITANKYIRNGLTLDNVIWAFGFTDNAYWHPLTWLSHMVDCQLFGLNAGMHHLINLILHISSSLLLFYVLKRITGDLIKSAFVAALFVLHPIQVESVAWAAERKNVLSTFFWMLTTLTYIRYVENPAFNRYFLVLIVFLLGLMAKPMLVTLPFVFFLLDYWALGRLKFDQSSIKKHEENHKSENNGFQHLPIFRLILEKIPLISFSAGAIYFSSLSVKHLVVSTESVPMKIRMANALVSYINYIKKMLWPFDLAVYYPYPQSIPLWQVAGAGLLLLGISFLVLRAKTSKPYLTVGWLWYIGTLFPVIGLVQAGLWPAMADRFVYVPLIGLFIIIAWGVPDILDRWRFKRIVLGILSAGLILTLIATTWLQLQHWQNGVKLFTHALKVTRNNIIAHNNLGQAMSKQGKYNEAFIHYVKALEINPNYMLAHNNLANIYFTRRKYEKSIFHYKKALNITPDCEVVHYNMGKILIQQGKGKDGLLHLLEAIKIKPEFAQAYNEIGLIFARQGDYKKACIYFSKAVKARPNFVMAKINFKKYFRLCYLDKKEFGNNG